MKELQSWRFVLLWIWLMVLASAALAPLIAAIHGGDMTDVLKVMADSPVFFIIALMIICNAVIAIFRCLTHRELLNENSKQD